MWRNSLQKGHMKTNLKLVHKRKHKKTPPRAQTLPPAATNEAGALRAVCNNERRWMYPSPRPLHLRGAGRLKTDREVNGTNNVVVGLGDVEPLRLRSQG